MGIKSNLVEMNPYTALSEKEILKKLSAAREHSAQRMQKDARTAVSDMRLRYGLDGSCDLRYGK